MFKVGLELFLREGPPVVKMVREMGQEVFLDLKLHDIPATVAAALRAVAALEPRLITVHADALIGLHRPVSKLAPGVGILAVTALTSLGPGGLAELGLKKSLLEPERLVARRARMARESGCSGVVCSGNEARRVRMESGPEFIIVAPGIRPAGSDAGDQARVSTPASAVAAGADYLVIGRPIRDAPDRVAAARAIAAEIVEGVDKSTTVGK
jgi:orotidine-5'-phosphate decarboxylase